MKKSRIVVAMATLLLSVAGVHAQDQGRQRFQFGADVRTDFAVGALREHELGNVSLGANFFYGIPGTDFGFDGSVDFGLPYKKADYIERWLVLKVSGGVFYDINCTSELKLRTEIDYGAAVNFVESVTRNVSGTMVDQMIRIEEYVIWSPDFMNGFSIYGSLSYELMPEKDNLGQDAGVKVGFLYRPPRN